MLEVLFLSAWYPFPPDNGSKLRVYHLLRSLGEYHNVDLLSFAFATARPDDADLYAGICRRVQCVTRDPNARSRLVRSLRFLSPQPISTLPIPAMRAQVRHALRDTQYDAVIASTGTMATYALSASKGTAMVLEEHNSFSRWMHDRHRDAQGRLTRVQTWISWQKTRAYESRLFPHFDLITMVSRLDSEVAQGLLRRDHPPVQVVANGVDCQHNRPGLALPHPDTLVYNGAMTYSANHDAMRYFLADVYPFIRQDVPAAKLTITGSTTGVDLDGLALDGSVHLSGYVDDIRPVIAESQVCVVPLRQGSGTRLKILEAMALGTPVVSTSKGAEGLNVVDGEHLLIADEPRAFAHATVRLLRDEPLRQRLTQNARRLVELRYDWRAIGAQFVRLVEQTVERKQRSHS